MQITIIGAGSGISRSVANLFGSKGYSIALIARNEEKLQKEVALLHEKGINAIYAVADAGNEKALNSALMQVSAKLGIAEMVLYNAYMPNFKALEAESWESIQQQLNVNVGGAFHLLKLALPYYKKQNKGKLFFTGGGLALNPMAKLVGLSMGKAALRNLVASTAAGLQKTNVHVATVTVCGFVNEKDPKHNPDNIAAEFWRLFNQEAGEFESEVIF